MRKYSFYGPMNMASMELIHWSICKRLWFLPQVNTCIFLYKHLCIQFGHHPWKQNCEEKEYAPFKGSRCILKRSPNLNAYQLISIDSDFCHQPFSTPFIRSMGIRLQFCDRIFPGPFPQCQERKTVKFLRPQEPEWLTCLTVSTISLCWVFSRIFVYSQVKPRRHLKNEAELQHLNPKWLNRLNSFYSIPWVYLPTLVTRPHCINTWRLFYGAWPFSSPTSLPVSVCFL